jgi:hypothetical protein
MTPTASTAPRSPVSPLSAGSEADDEDDGSEGYASAEDGSDDEFLGYGDDSPVEIVALPVATAAAAAPVGTAHPRLVTVVKPPPPALPPRNPVRARKAAAAAAAAAAAGAPFEGDGPTSAPSAAPAVAPTALSQPEVLPPPMTSVLPSVWADDVNDAALLGGQDAMRQRAESASSSVYSASGRQTTGIVGGPQAGVAANTPGLAI